MGSDAVIPFNVKSKNNEKTSDTTEANYANKKGFYITFNSIFIAGRVDFKAFITSYHDNLTADWSSDTPYGRVDSVKTHSQTSRQIDIAFSVPAYSVHEAKENLAKASALIKMLYPSYENRAFSGTGLSQSAQDLVMPPEHSTNDRYCISAPPLLTVKFANLIQTIRPTTVNIPSDGDLELDKTFLEGEMRGVIAVVQNFSLSPRVDVGFFEKREGDDVMLYPKVFDIALNFIVLHQVSPGIAAESAPFISEDHPTKTYGDLYGVGYAPTDGSSGDAVFNNLPAYTVAAARRALEAAGEGQALEINKRPGGPTRDIEAPDPGNADQTNIPLIGGGGANEGDGNPDENN